MLPQRPTFDRIYAAIVYPAEANAFSADQVRDALVAIGLPGLADRLDEEAHWNRMLSLGEQQRLGLARALLHAPEYLFLDEATASLDEPSEAALYRLLADKLPSTTVISIGHRSTLEAFHERKLAMVRDGDRFTLREAGAGAKPDTRERFQMPYSQRRGMTGRTHRCQTQAKAASNNAPASTGANRNVQGRLLRSPAAD